MHTPVHAQTAGSLPVQPEPGSTNSSKQAVSMRQAGGKRGRGEWGAECAD